MRIGRISRRLLAGLVALAALGAAAPAMAACGVATPQSRDLGTVSPPALKQATTPPIGAYAGFNCPTGSILTVLGANYLRATLAATPVLQLTGPGGAIVTYTLYADAAGTRPLIAGTPTAYIDGTTIDLLGLAGSGAMNVPVYVKPASATILAPGTYTGSFAVKWDWYFCTGIAVGGLCVNLGAIDQGSRTGTVTLTLTVAGNPVTMTVSSMTTWDPVGTTSNPKSLPGSKRRTTITVTNPDTATVDLNTLALALPTAPRTAVALDGDGTSGTFVVFTQGATSSALTLGYTGSGSETDNVDFSNDSGASWSYLPGPGSDPAVTTVRFRPQGSMAAKSSFSISIPYLVK